MHCAGPAAQRKRKGDFVSVHMGMLLAFICLVASAAVAMAEDGPGSDSSDARVTGGRHHRYHEHHDWEDRHYDNPPQYYRDDGPYDMPYKHYGPGLVDPSPRKLFV